MSEGRPKGLIVYEPKKRHIVEALAQVQEILDEYRDHLPLTVRQVFYRMVGRYGFAKDERAYKRLADWIKLARRGLLIPFSAIRDDGNIARIPPGYHDVDSFWHTVAEAGKNFRRQRLDGQNVYVELVCEAGGMVPQMVRVAHDYGVPVYSGGGFNSLTGVKDVVDRVLARDKPTVLLHVGDFDPSGVSIFDTLQFDVRKMVGQIVGLRDNAEFTDYVAPGVDVQPNAALIPVRVAITEQQVLDHNVMTAPPKDTDTRSANWPLSWTAQAEALDPPLLAQIVRDAIEDHLDLTVLQDVIDAEEADRQAIAARLNGSG